MSDPREVTVTIHNKYEHLNKNVRVIPAEPQGEIHIYQGHGGYKLSIGERHLTLAELVYVVQKMNNLHRYGA